MASKKHARRRARESALALLYSGDITERDAVSVVEEGLYPADDLVLTDYAEELVNGVAEHLENIDAHLASTSENWSVDRMPVVDRAILRLAVYEMLYVKGVPVSVAINEAVELAKAYGGEDESSRFVNGVLGRIARSLEGEEAAASQETAESEATGPEPTAAPDDSGSGASAAALPSEGAESDLDAPTEPQLASEEGE